MASIKDVAKKAGVSISTVSYAISGKRPVSQETRELVFKTMKELGYKSHAVARALASKRTRILALVLSPQERALGITELDFITTASERAIAKGYHLVLWTVGKNPIKELQDLIEQGWADGVILMEIRENDPRVKWLKNSNFPCELIGRCSCSEGLNYTDIDFYNTVYDALTYLKELGHMHIALVNQSEDVFSAGYGPVVRVHNDFQAICLKFGIEGGRFFTPPNPSDGYRTMEKILKEFPETTAIIAMNDAAIPGILRAATDKKLIIPEDLSLLSIVSSSRFAEMMIPALSEMEVPTRDLMYDAVDSLIARLEGEENIPPGRLWPCRLNIRKSTAVRR